MAREVDNQETPDLIRVQVTNREEVQADRADLHVTIQGSSLVTGNAALQKAREVNQLVTALMQGGVPEKDIHLQGVSAEVSSGMLSRSSSATYVLKIHCANLDILADVLGIITSQKNTKLRYLEWGYPDDSDLREQWLDACIDRANRKAHRIAAALGVELIGVRTFMDHLTDPEDQRHQVTVAAASVRRRAAMTSEDLGLEVSHTKTVELHVVVEYRIGEFARTGTS